MKELYDAIKWYLDTNGVSPVFSDDQSFHDLISEYRIAQQDMIKQAKELLFRSGYLVVTVGEEYNSLVEKFYRLTVGASLVERLIEIEGDEIDKRRILDILRYMLSHGKTVSADSEQIERTATSLTESYWNYVPRSETLK